jgi:predicted RNA-binding protein with TRAM domain
MENQNELLCMFTGKVKENNGSYYIEVPENEIRHGTLDVNAPVSVSVKETPNTQHQQTQQQAPSGNPNGGLETPVDEGDVVEVNIEDMGDQGDGIARIEGGYVLIVPDTDPGDVEEVEIKHVNRNYAYAELTNSTETPDIGSQA